MSKPYRPIDNVKLQEGPNGQFTVTVLREAVRAHGWKRGDVLDVYILRPRDRLFTENTAVLLELVEED